MSESDNIIKFQLNAKMAFVKSEKTYVRSKEVNVVKEKELPKRIKVENPLTKQHREELNYWINEWVTTSNLAKKPIAYGKAYNKLYADGLDGEVNGIGQIEQSEFQQCVSFIQQRIRVLETVGNKRVMRRKADYRSSRITAIHTRCKELGVSDETRKAYQLYRFKKGSMKDFTDDELEEYYGYVMRGTPRFFIPKKAAPSVQKDRESALLILLGILEGEAISKGRQFNRQALSYRKEEMLNLLEQREPDLFDISLDTFNEFWDMQKHCKARSGRKPGQSARR